MTTKCGVLGVYNNTKYCNIPDFIKSLDKLQHRGLESCGVCYNIDNKMSLYKQNGLVKDVFEFILENPESFENYNPKYMPHQVLKLIILKLKFNLFMEKMKT